MLSPLVSTAGTSSLGSAGNATRKPILPSTNSDHCAGGAEAGADELGVGAVFLVTVELVVALVLEVAGEGADGDAAGFEAFDCATCGCGLLFTNQTMVVTTPTSSNNAAPPPTAAMTSGLNRDVS